MVAIALARLLVPLLIPRFPLAIVAALVLDAVDNSLLARFSDVNLGPDGAYQSFDKALDIYYLAIAYLATMRNWTSFAAFRIGRFLFYYRLVGVFLFEVLDSRAMLLVFPNTFEYTLESAAAEFAALLAVNLGLVYIASRFIGDRDTFPLGEGLFFALLGTLVLWLFDAYKPLADARFAGSEQGRATT